MDPLTLFILFCLVVVVVNRADKVIARRRKDRLDQATGPQPICGCEDHYAFHDPTTGHCHATSKVPSKWDGDGFPIAYKQQQCGCRQYVGPQPLDTFYAPEITGDTTIPPRLTKGDDTEER